MTTADAIKALQGEWGRIRTAFSEHGGEGVPVEILTRALLLARECDVLARTVPAGEQLSEVNEIRQWLRDHQIPALDPANVKAAWLAEAREHVLTREGVIRMMRDANDSGADLWMHLANEFGIEDEELKREFRYTIHEDVVAAATRATRHLIAKPRGALGREVREDIQVVLDAVTNGDREVVE